MRRSPGPLRRIAQVEAGRLLERIVALERLLHAVEFVDCAAELANGRAACPGGCASTSQRGAGIFSQPPAQVGGTCATKIGSQPTDLRVVQDHSKSSLILGELLEVHVRGEAA